MRIAVKSAQKTKDLPQGADPAFYVIRVAKITAVCGLILVLVFASLTVGAAGLGLDVLFQSDEGYQLLLISRLPRTLALILAAAACSIAGVILQRMAANKFIEPSTIGTTEGAALGLLLVHVVQPGAPIYLKMILGGAFACLTTTMFLVILRFVPRTSPLMPPLIGFALSGIIGGIGTYIAWQVDLVQAMSAWTTGDFSVVLSGRYELLYIAAVLTGVSWILADRFTLVGLGETTAQGVGLRPEVVLMQGVIVSSLLTASTLVTVGALPFLGLVAPYVVSLRMGDNLRKNLPWIVLIGVCLTLVCDIIGRLVIYPFEIPIGATLGIVGAAVFLFLLLKGARRVS